MVWTATRTLVLCLAGVLGVQPSMAAGQAGNAWTMLLDGTSLKGWNVVGGAVTIVAPVLAALGALAALLTHVKVEIVRAKPSEGDEGTPE